MAEDVPDLTMADAIPATPLFDELVFTIIPGDKLAPADVENLSNIIVENGGKFISLNEKTGRISEQIMKQLTHIVASTSDFPDYLDAFDQFKHIVRPAWISDSLRKGKATNPRQYSPDPALFMSEVIVFCSDLPPGDEEAIKGGVMAMGGNYSEKLSKFVTHIVALRFDSEACALAVRKNLKAKIVLPHWFDDCLKLGRKISEHPYLLADPEILKANGGKADFVQPQMKNNRTINGASDPRPEGQPTPASSPMGIATRELNVFKGRKLKISEELELRPNIVNVISDLVEGGGGQITRDIEEATTYICHYRDGEDYIKASQVGLEVGNLAWLYYLISHNKWTSPLRRLLHYPIPRNGLPGFKNFRISLSNYTGEARIYLENLVKATGAEYTKTMKQDNTHLLTAHTNSEKCTAAREWGINIVNHIWLEESYAQCRLLTLTNTRFTHFPARTNLGEVCGHAVFDRSTLERYYFPKKQKVIKKVAVVVENPARTTPRSKSGKDADDRMMEGSVRTPATRRINENKENETPGTTGSRGAKARALSKLHDLVPDMELYQKEMKRVGGVTHGRDRRKDKSSEPDDDEEEEGEEEKAAKPTKRAQGRKRSMDPDEDEESAAEEPKKATKKKKTGKTGALGPIKHHMLVTKYDPWVENIKKEDEDRAKLRDLGITLTTEKDRNVTILCAPKIVRTKKFVSALAAAPVVVSTQYLDHCLTQGELPDPEDFPLLDRDAEKKFGIKLVETLKYAEQNNRRLLKDWPIMCTESVPGGYQTYADIVEANGGKCLLWKGRTNMTISIRGGGGKAKAAEDEEKEEIYLISEAKESEVPLWKKFRELADKANMVPRIVSTEWLLFVAMSQYVHYDEKWALSEEKLRKKKR